MQMGLFVPGARVRSVGAKTTFVAKTSTRAGTVTQLTASTRTPSRSVLIAMRRRCRHPDTTLRISTSCTVVPLVTTEYMLRRNCNVLTE